MTEQETITKINLLSDYESRRDLLRLDKQKLLEDVKVPEEIQSIVSAGMQKMKDVQRSFTPEADALTIGIKAELDAVVVPEEIKAQLAEIDKKRNEIMARHQAGMASISARMVAAENAIHAEVDATTKEVYAAIARRKAEIEAEFADKEEAVDANIQKLMDEIKAEVVQIGFSVKGDHYYFIYNKPQKTWIPPRLEKYTEDHLDIKSCYTLGKPSVTARKI